MFVGMVGRPAITPNVLGLGEVAFVRWLVGGKIAQNPCYRLMRIFSTHFQIVRKYFKNS